jgi:hypothetical protein
VNTSGTSWARLTGQACSGSHPMRVSIALVLRWARDLSGLRTMS